MSAQKVITCLGPASLFSCPAQDATESQGKGGGRQALHKPQHHTQAPGPALFSIPAQGSLSARREQEAATSFEGNFGHLQEHKGRLAALLRGPRVATNCTEHLHRVFLGHLRLLGELRGAHAAEVGGHLEAALDELRSQLPRQQHCADVNVGQASVRTHGASEVLRECNELVEEMLHKHSALSLQQTFASKRAKGRQKSFVSL